MKVLMLYRCEICKKLFMKDTCVEVSSENNITEQLVIKGDQLVDTLTEGAYPLKTLHYCGDNQYGMGKFLCIKLR